MLLYRHSKRLDIYSMGLNTATGRPVIRNTETVLWFGRYQGYTIEDILHDDPAYLVWAQDNVDAFDMHCDLLDRAERRSFLETLWDNQTDYFWRYK